MERPNAILSVIAILVVVGVITATAVANSVTIRSSTSQVNELVTNLARTRDRDECARQIAADLVEQWQHGIDDLLAGTTREDYRAIGRRLKTLPNAADLINDGGTLNGRKVAPCPRPIRGNG